jgi:hypothetical protein
MGVESWRPLSAGTCEGRALGIDFAQGRTTPGLHTLAANLEIPQALVEPLARMVHPTRAALSDPDGYLLPWRAEVASEGRPVHAVLGYCSGASVACSLADMLVEQGARTPALILLNPATATKRTLCAEFGQAVESLTEGLREGEYEAALADMYSLYHDEGVDLPTAAVDLTARYGKVARVAASRLDLGSCDIADELTERFGSYLTYLVVTAALPLTSEHCERTIVYSTDHRVERSCEAGSLRVDVGAGGHVLSDHGVARLVSTVCAEQAIPVT